MNKEVKKRYFYHDTPDGEDILPKLWCVLKPAAVTTLAIGTCDVMLYSYPKGYLATLGRYVYVAIPILGMSTAFVLTTNMLCSIRNKSDVWNWAAGGAVAGGILGAWRGSPQVGGVGALFLGLAGLLKKHTHMNGIVLVPNLNHPKMAGGVKSVRHDFSLLQDKHGEWKKKWEGNN